MKLRYTKVTWVQKSGWETEDITEPVDSKKQASERVKEIKKVCVSTCYYSGFHLIDDKNKFIAFL